MHVACWQVVAGIRGSEGLGSCGRRGLECQAGVMRAVQ